MDFNYPKSVRFECVKCGICCGDTKEKNRHILLLRAEAEQIAASTSQPIFEFAIKTIDKTPYAYEMKKTAKEGTCVFLENNRCTIYLLRPLICRFYPFELKITQGQKYAFLYTDECKGINKGRLISGNYFRKLFQLAHEKARESTEENKEKAE